jgi:putative transposase
MILLHFGISLRRALDLIGLSSFMFYYRRKRDDLEALALVRSYADEHPAHGQDMMAKVFHRSHGWNHKKTERLYAKLKLAKVRKKRLRRLVQPKEPLLQPLAANECWSMDFMSDSLMDGSKVRVLNVIDDYNRQYLGFDIGRSLPAPRVTRALDDFIDFHGKPKRIRIDNGPEYTSHHMQLWAKERGILLQFIQPGKPTQNSYIERFNRTYRTEVLNSYLFSSIQEVHATTEKFQHNYNYNRPHGSLNDLPPVEFKDHRNNYIDPLKNKSSEKEKKPNLV